MRDVDAGLAHVQRWATRVLNAPDGTYSDDEIAAADTFDRLDDAMRRGETVPQPWRR